jgi:hypothetical protein
VAAAVAPIPSSVSADTLTSDIQTGATADATTVAGESSDSATVSADAANYSDVKTSSYDNTL